MSEPACTYCGSKSIHRAEPKADWAICKRCHAKFEESSKEPKQIEILRAALDRAIKWIEHDIPEPPGHMCGTPDSNCDMSCVDWARFSSDMVHFHMLVVSRDISTDVVLDK